ncbi:DUF2332 domain-containing protein [Pseudotabrizicola sp.]|uniref:DUF2332 domain-containing protein n=1 Tax=Pseudotabrizicola sp. TaxID=2939647 RepID=UPI0027164564|nr:DUF2332 family protein [Pseudotabrizicola sp.]MDO8882975.1 DUF2332 family protein [Pseudotabrizicola sp.]
MTDSFGFALEEQAGACDALGSPFTARLLRVLGQVWPRGTMLAQQVAAWPGDLGPRAASVPLRIAGGLHALVLAGRVPDLAALYPPDAGRDLAAPLVRALLAEDAFLCDWVKTAPQTNEVGRSAVLLAAAAEVTRRYGLPLVLSELGASAGLNLWFDRYALQVPEGVIGASASLVRLCPDWRGGVVPPVTRITVAARRGVDLHPLDPTRDGARLMAFVWADQADRLARLQAALGVGQSAVVDAGDAADWLEARLSQPRTGAVHLVYHTIAHQYFPAIAQDRIAVAMALAGERATPDAPLVWLGMEADGADNGAAVTLRLWPGDLRITLGRAGFHGQWLEWRGAGG